MQYLKKFEEISFGNLFNKKKEEKPQPTGEVIIRPMKEEDVDDCLDLKYQYFGHFYGDLDDPMTKAYHDNYALSKLDLSVSLIAEIDGKIVGGYILEKTGLPMYPGNFYDFSGEKLTGVEGVSLFVDPNYKSAGIGHKLKYYYKENKHPEISFIWGMAFHGLNNMNHWLKTRTMFNDLFGVYYTIEFYTPGGINKYPKTKYLDFYEQHKVTVVDYINSQLKKGKKVQYFSIDKISEVLADYGFDKSEVMEIANYCKEE